MATAWTQMNLVKRVLDRHQQLDARRDPYTDITKLVAEYCLPELPSGSDARTGRHKLSDKVYHGGPAYAAEIMASGIINNLVSPSVDWRQFKMPGNKFRRNKRVNTWLKNMDDAMGEAYRRTTYYDVVGDFMLHGVTVGSPVMMCDPDTKNGGKHHFWVPDWRDRWIGQNDMDEDNVLHVMHHYTALDVWTKFGKGKDKTNIPANVRELINNGNHWQNQDVIQAIYERTDPIFTGLPKDAIGEDGRPDKPDVIPAKAPWICVYVLKDKTNAPHPLAITPYYHKPFSVFHWRKLRTTSYAVTPGWKALTDIIRSQTVHKDWLMGGSLKVRPPNYILDTVAAKLQLWPGGVTRVTAEEYDKVPKPVFNDTELGVAREVFEYIDECVDRWFMVHFIMQLTQMLKSHKGFPTATEVMQLSAEKMGIVMPTVEKVETKLLWTVDDLMFELEAKAGRLPLADAPAELVDEAKGKAIKPQPEFVGKLARLQMHIASLQRAESMAAAVGPWVQVDNRLAAKFKGSVIVDHLAEDTNFWPDALRDEKEYQEELDRLAKSEQAAAMVDSGSKVAQTIKALSGPVDETSLLASGSRM